MKRYVLLIFILCLGLPVSAFSYTPNTTLEMAKPAESTEVKKVYSSEIVRVGIGNSTFSNYAYNEIGVYGTAPLNIYTNGIMVKQVPANTNVIVTINPDFTYTLKSDEGEEIATLTGIIKFTASGGCLGIKGLTRAGKPALYHGYFDIMQVTGKQQFNLVNKLPVEVYLRGVVPNEMPVSFGLEALKAQSIAARNYVLSPRAKSSPNYDVVDSVASQVYFGANTEKALSNQAVEQTEGIVALYNWDLILALYSSTAGGYTESYSNAFSDPQTGAFPAAEKPFLKAKPDILTQTSLKTEDAASVFYKSKPDSYDIRSPYFRWERDWSPEELKQTLQSTLISQSATGFVKPAFNKGDTLDDLTEIKVLKRGDSGKIIEMEIVTKSQTYKLFKELVIRRAIMKDGKALPSANVVFENIKDDEGNLTGIKAYGGGFGHGVGLSQFGAGFMGAELHLPYYKILQHYYSNITLATKPVIISTAATQISAIQQFYAPSKYAKIVIDNRYGVNELVVKINGQEQKYQLPKEVFGYKRYCEIDISNNIKIGKNIIEFTSPEFTGSSMEKGLRLFVELVEKDESSSIWE